jgi:hypothetical protein
MQKSVADADLISKPKRTTKSTIILRVRDSIFTVFRGPCSDTCIPHSAVCCQKFPWCADRLYYSLHAHRHRGCDIDRQLAARPRERLFEAVRSTMDNFSRYRTHTHSGRSCRHRTTVTAIERCPTSHCSWPAAVADRMPRKPPAMAWQLPTIQSTTTWLAFRGSSKDLQRK